MRYCQRRHRVPLKARQVCYVQTIKYPVKTMTIARANVWQGESLLSRQKAGNTKRWVVPLAENSARCHIKIQCILTTEHFA